MCPTREATPHFGAALIRSVYDYETLIGYLDIPGLISLTMLVFGPSQMHRERNSFLSNMAMIWDCYVPFVRHYGDHLPGVFDPVPFLDLPKVSWF